MDVMTSTSLIISSDVLDARGGIDLDLTTALPQKKLNGSEVALVDGQVLVKFGPET